MVKIFKYFDVRCSMFDVQYLLSPKLGILVQE